MTNPFEDPAGEYLALVNHEGQYSLWPGSIEVPDGWSVSCGPADRETCLAHIEALWQDMRPRSLTRSAGGTR